VQVGHKAHNVLKNFPHIYNETLVTLGILVLITVLVVMTVLASRLLAKNIKIMTLREEHRDGGCLRTGC
jgi:hypothetical protein